MIAKLLFLLELTVELRFQEPDKSRTVPKKMVDPSLSPLPLKA